MTWVDLNMRGIEIVAAGVIFLFMASAASAGPVAAPRPNPLRAGAAPTEAAVEATRPAVGTPASAAVQPTPGPAPAKPVVIDARVGLGPGRTRFVVELSDPVKFRVFTLANPNRVVIDMPEVLWRLKGPQPPPSKGAIKGYRYGLFRPGNSRFVIDLDEPVSVAEPLVLPPEDGFGYRVVIDLSPQTQTAFDTSAGWPADLRVQEAATARQATLAPIPRATGADNSAHLGGRVPGSPVHHPIVVIDAGHGGIDSGTIGVTGMEEKDLVLDEALRLRRALRNRGYIVHLTRDTDTFIPLRTRVEIGRHSGADLFISLHADSNPDSAVAGASVYTLSEKGSDKEAAALARKENQSDIIAGVDLSGDNSSVASILIDLAQRDTMNRSSRFAQTVVRDLSGATDVLPRAPHRSAAFVVLKAPDVPAVLIELGYLSNDHDCHQMATAGWRNSVAEAIAGAVDQQFEATLASPRAERAEAE